MKTALLRRAIATAHALDAGGYDYHLLPFGENGTALPIDLVDEVSQGLLALAQPFRSQFQYVCAVAPGGHTWGLLLARDLHLDLAILRAGWVSRRHKLRRPGREAESLRLPEMIRGANVLLLDDVISTGITTIQIVADLTRHNVTVVAITAIYSKNNGQSRVMDETAIPVKCLIAE